MHVILEIKWGYTCAVQCDYECFFFERRGTHVQTHVLHQETH